MKRIMQKIRTTISRSNFLPVFLLWLAIFTTLVACLRPAAANEKDEAAFRMEGVPLIRVGLVISQFSAEIVADGDFTVTSPDGKKVSLPKGKYFAAADKDKILLGDIPLASGSVLVPGESRHSFAVNRQEYWGRLKIYVTEAGKNLTLVNMLPLEFYVNSVLGPKSSPIWPDEAIKAQAVAVRSLAWSRMAQGSLLFDVRAADPEAFYGGIRTENENVTKIAALTSGQVLYYGNSPAAAYMNESSGGITVSGEEVLGRNIPYLIPVKDYDSDSPSFTWDKKILVTTIARILNQNGHTVGKLQGYQLTDSRAGKEERGASAEDPAAGHLPGSKDRYASGRVRAIYWKGDQGSVTLTGQEFADLLALSSNWFDIYSVEPVPEKLDVSIENGYGIKVGEKEIPIEIRGPEGNAWKSAVPGYHFLNGSKDETLLFKGKGSGNGLGLSKWGARGMADAAPENAVNYYRTILAHYYPGTSLRSVY